MSGVVLPLDEVEPAPSVVTIGNFDGVHRGHRLLLSRTVDGALDRGVRSVAVTFDPHPASIVRPDAVPLALCSLDERCRLLIDAGVDLVVIVAFTDALSRLTPAEFVEAVLVDRLRAGRVIIGSNFRFGHRAAGDVVTLVELGELHGFDVEAVAVRHDDDQPISSSAIRDALLGGDVSRAATALGRLPRLIGEVVAGDGRGRTIGVPTANVAISDGLVVPARGVYVALAHVDDVAVPAVVNVGVRPTVTDGVEQTVEVHVIDRDVDLYGQQLTVDLVDRIRGEQRFDSVDDLVAAIRADIDVARERLAG
ncbi:MAG: bifunctional riboflavin kinase/FAD synthetase [Nitriliruptoraceae bacterium]